MLVSLRNTGNTTTFISQDYQMLDEGLTLETSASETHYNGQFTMSTKLVKPSYIVYPTKVSLETYPVD